MGAEGLGRALGLNQVGKGVGDHCHRASKHCRTRAQPESHPQVEVQLIWISLQDKDSGTGISWGAGKEQD